MHRLWCISAQQVPSNVFTRTHFVYERQSRFFIASGIRIERYLLILPRVFCVTAVQVAEFPIMRIWAVMIAFAFFDDSREGTQSNVLVFDDDHCAEFGISELLVLVEVEVEL
jgi:hypothetical protein